MPRPRRVGVGGQAELVEGHIQVREDVLLPLQVAVTLDRARGRQRCAVLVVTDGVGPFPADVQLVLVAVGGAYHQPRRGNVWRDERVIGGDDVGPLAQYGKVLGQETSLGIGGDLQRFAGQRQRLQLSRDGFVQPREA